MGKTWNKRDGHTKHSDKRRSKDEFRNYDTESYNSKFNRQSLKKNKEARRRFEDDMSGMTIQFPD